MTPVTLQREGERLKLGAFAILSARRESLIRRARRALLASLLQGGDTVTIDEVRAVVPVPDGINPKAFGPVPFELAAAGIIVADGFVQSARPEAHARPVKRWRLVDRAAAANWLAIHPELADPATPAATDLFGEVWT